MPSKLRDCDAPRNAQAWPMPLSPWKKSPGIHSRPTPELMWRYITEAVEVPGVVKEVFGKPSSVAARQAAAFIRQAEAFYACGARTAGPTSALPYYYSFMNLAKAELIARTGKVLPQALVHGLKSSIGVKRKLGPYLSVTESGGVFARLLQARTAQQIRKGTAISLYRLLGSCSDIGFEALESTLPGVHLLPRFFVRHSVLWEGNDARSVIGLYSDEPLSCRGIGSKLREHFCRCNAGPMQAYWFRLDFNDPVPSLYLLGKSVVSNPNGLTGDDLISVVQATYSLLVPYIDESLDPKWGGYISPSFLAKSTLVIPGPLAAYAMLFHISNEVRYRPDQLENKPELRWLHEALVVDAPATLLYASLCGIRGRHYLFFGLKLCNGVGRQRLPSGLVWRQPERERLSR